MKRRLNWILAAGVSLGVTLGLTGCGQKGPLYLPDRSGSVVTRPSGAAGAEGNEQPAPESQSLPAVAPEVQTPQSQPSPRRTAPTESTTDKDDGSQQPKN